MRIGIEINGVLRDTLKKIQEVYEKWYIENPFSEEQEFKYEIISDCTTLNILEHLKFKDSDELYNFLYKEYTMEIFGHAGSVEYNGMNDFNDFYLDMRDNHEIIIVSDEMGKSKPASLFFLSKFGCLSESVKFYSESTINLLWDSVDILLTANPNLLLNYPSNKKVIKYETTYNQDIKTEHSIQSIKEFKTKLQEIYD
jgi:acetone carboxylase gamma subunit